MEWNEMNWVQWRRVYQFREYDLVVVGSRLFADLCAAFRIHEMSSK